jgi:hypothetical protein
MQTANQQSENVQNAGFLVRCSQCGVGANETAGITEAQRFIQVPQSEYALLECFCHNCNRYFDMACWVPDPRALSKHFERDARDPSLLQRYRNAVWKAASSRTDICIFDGGFLEIKGSITADLEFLDENAKPRLRTNLPVIPMQALALARGLRMALMRSPDRLLRATIGSLDLFLSMAEPGSEIGSYGMSLSVFDGQRTPVSNLGFNFAISLFFAVEESDYGNEVPSTELRHMRHFLVPLPSSSVEIYPNGRRDTKQIRETRLRRAG